MKKICSTCKAEKELIEFQTNKTALDLHRNICKLCRNAQQRKYRTLYPQRIMLKKAKQRSIKYGIEFTITEDDIIIPDKCPYLGIPLITGVGKVIANSPTLDRIDPTLGYIPGNVTVCSFRANAIKRDATPAELKSMYLAVKDMVRKSK